MELINFMNLEYFILILLIFLLIFIMYRNIKYIEPFGGSSDAVAFTIPSQKRWTFDQSIKWYQIKQNGYSIRFYQTGINVYNKNISFLFLINVFKVANFWRNIFHFTSTARDCCNRGDRLPAMWIRPDKTHSYHIRFSTDSYGNDGIDMEGYNLSLGVPIFIGLVFNNNTFSIYINNILYQQNNYNNIHKRNNNTVLYIGNPWYKQDGNVYIKNFTIYDGALSQQDIKNVYDKLSEKPSGSIGPPGIAGQSGIPGKNGAPGPIGQQGQVGDNGPTGPTGPKGNIGYQGATGLNAPEFSNPIATETRI
jgi:hypothetical protein